MKAAARFVGGFRSLANEETKFIGRDGARHFTGGASKMRGGMFADVSGGAMDADIQARALICEIGRRLYARGLAAGNDGNLSIRMDQERVLCTPTLISKGFMTPADLCIVDLSGSQLAGSRPRTSEVLLHLEIYKGDPGARAVVHCHPPHATAFGMAQVDIPTGILPEAEIFLGAVPRAAYATPGTADFAATVRPFIGRASAVVLSNHGTVSWAADLERAYWYTETLDAYCRMLMLAKFLGHVERLPEEKVRELMALRPAFGLGPDPRLAGDGALYVNRGFGDAAEPDCRRAP